MSTSMSRGFEVVVISGPSGVGKGTLIAKLLEDFPTQFGFAVSHTTRDPRANEVNGVHYHFVTSQADFEEEISKGSFLEYALVHGSYYGTSRKAVEFVTVAGKCCILDIDVQGARQVRATCPGAKLIFVAPPSIKELKERLRSRNTETEEQIQVRLENARVELSQSGEFDHELINRKDNLNECYERLKNYLGLPAGMNQSLGDKVD